MRNAESLTAKETTQLSAIAQAHGSQVADELKRRMLTRPGWITDFGVASLLDPEQYALLLEQPEN